MIGKVLRFINNNKAMVIGAAAASTVAVSTVAVAANVEPVTETYVLLGNEFDSVEELKTYVETKMNVDVLDYHAFESWEVDGRIFETYDKLYEYILETGDLQTIEIVGDPTKWVTNTNGEILSTKIKVNNDHIKEVFRDKNGYAVTNMDVAIESHVSYERKYLFGGKWFSTPADAYSYGTDQFMVDLENAIKTKYYYDDSTQMNTTKNDLLNRIQNEMSVVLKYNGVDFIPGGLNWDWESINLLPSESDKIGVVDQTETISYISYNDSITDGGLSGQRFVKSNDDLSAITDASRWEDGGTRQVGFDEMLFGQPVLGESVFETAFNLIHVAADMATNDQVAASNIISGEDGYTGYMDNIDNNEVLYNKLVELGYYDVILNKFLQLSIHGLDEAKLSLLVFEQMADIVQKSNNSSADITIVMNGFSDIMYEYLSTSVPSTKEYVDANFGKERFRQVPMDDIFDFLIFKIRPVNDPNDLGNPEEMNVFVNTISSALNMESGNMQSNTSAVIADLERAGSAIVEAGVKGADKFFRDAEIASGKAVADLTEADKLLLNRFSKINIKYPKFKGVSKVAGKALVYAEAANKILNFINSFSPIESKTMSFTLPSNEKITFSGEYNKYKVEDPAKYLIEKLELKIVTIRKGVNHTRYSYNNDKYFSRETEAEDYAKKKVFDNLFEYSEMTLVSWRNKTYEFDDKYSVNTNIFNTATSLLNPGENYSVCIVGDPSPPNPCLFLSEEYFDDGFGGKNPDKDSAISAYNSKISNTILQQAFFLRYESSVGSGVKVSKEKSIVFLADQLDPEFKIEDAIAEFIAENNFSVQSKMIDINELNSNDKFDFLDSAWDEKYEVSMITDRFGIDHYFTNNGSAVNFAFKDNSVKKDYSVEEEVNIIFKDNEFSTYDDLWEWVSANLEVVVHGN